MTVRTSQRLQAHARPRGLLGRLIGCTMARRNAQLTRRVVAALKLCGDETVVEFGPGPGVGLQLLAEALPNGRVVGAEPSPVIRAQAGEASQSESDLQAQGAAAAVLFSTLVRSGFLSAETAGGAVAARWG